MNLEYSTMCKCETEPFSFFQFRPPKYFFIVSIFEPTVLLDIQNINLIQSMVKGK